MKDLLRPARDKETAPEGPPGLLNWDEAAALLGYKSRRRLRQAVARGEVAFVRLSGARIAFTRGGLDDFIARRTQEATAP